MPLVDYQRGLSPEDAEMGYEALRQRSIAEDEKRRRRLSDLQANPNVMRAQAEAEVFRRNPKLQSQFMLEREKSRLRKQELLAKPVKPSPPTPFESEIQKQSAKDYTKLVQDSTKFSDQLDLTKQAINQFRDYTTSELLGTGPIATIGGLTKYVSSKTEALDSAFKKIDLRNMVATFSGMSRAIDTDRERAAWNATQAGIATDDPTNAKVLVGSLSLAAKTNAEGEARRKYIESSPEKSLKGYVSPVIGKTAVLFNAEGDPIVVPKEQVKELTKQGMLTDSEYERSILEGAVSQKNSVIDSLVDKYTPR